MTELSVLEYLANALWQLPLLALGAWLFVSALRPGPRIQHRIWLTALVLALALPAVKTHPILTLTANPVAVATEAPAASPAPVSPALASSALADRPEETSAIPLVEAISPPSSLPAVAPTPRHRLRVTLSPLGAHLILALFTASLLFGALRIAHAWRAARRLVRDSDDLILTPTQRAAWSECAARFEVELPHIRASHALASPVIVGAFHPVLLLPHNFARHTADEVRAVLCHELAHIARRDYLANLVCLVAALPLVWHPVSHHVQRRIGRTREMACDQMAAAAMDSETVYARCLLALARQMLTPTPATSQIGVVGLLGHNVLEERLMRLMARKTTLSLRAKLVRGTTGALVMTSVVIAAMLLRVTPMLASVAAPAAPAIPALAAPAPPAPIQAVPSVPPAPAASAVPAPDPLLPVSPEAPLAPPAATLPAVPATPAVAPQAPAPAPEPAALPAPAAPPAPATQPEPAPLPDQATGNSSSPGPASSASRSSHSASASGSMSSSDGTHHSFSIHRDADGKTIVIRDGVRRELTPAQEAEMERDIKSQVDAETARFRSPEYRNQLTESSRKLAEQQSKLYRLDAEKYRLNAEKYRLEAEKQTEYLRSPEFQREMEKLNSPEFKKQMEDAQKAIESAQANIHLPELNLQLDMPNFDTLKLQSDPTTAALQHQLDSARHQMEAASHQMEAASRRLEEATRALQEAQSKADKNKP